MAVVDSKVHLNKRDTKLAVVCVLLTLAFQSTWYFAPDLLSKTLWEGAALNLAFFLGSISLAVPVAVAWWCISGDKPASRDETYETSHH